MMPRDALPVAAGHRPARAAPPAVLAERPPVPWFEVHSENYFAEGGPALAALDRIRADYPLSLHGVGLSLGSTDPLSRAHLAKLDTLIRASSRRSSPSTCAGAASAGRHFNDLLPLPFTDEALAHVCARVEEVQDFLGREIAVENISVVRRLRRIDDARMGIRRRRRAADGLQARSSTSTTSTSTPSTTGSTPTRISRRCRRKPSPRSTSPDSTRPAPASSTPTARASRRRYGRSTARTIARIGPRPTLIEWDVDIPEFAVLEDEAATAAAMLDRLPCRRC